MLLGSGCGLVGRIREARAALAAVPGVGLLSEETQTAPWRNHPQYAQKFDLSSCSVCASLSEVSLAPGPLGLEVDAPTGLVQKVLEGGAGATRWEVCSRSQHVHLVFPGPLGN